MEKFIKKYKYYFLSFILPLLICILILGLKGVIQNIDRIYVSDLSDQHIIFLKYLKGIMQGRNSLEYSYYAGMGSPMLATMIFYCVSPFNILLILIDDIQWAVIIINILKISLSGLTMFILLRYKTKRKNYMTLAFSTGYAVSSFVINFFFCVFWFDSVYLAPLVMLGIDKMYKEEKINFIYIFSLALAIICNIQMGFGLCVYSVIYFLYLFNIKYSIFKDLKKFRKLVMIFGISSLCAGAISSGILLGFLSEYRHIIGARDGFFSGDIDTSNIFYIIKNIFTVGYLSDGPYSVYEPYISSGLIVSYFVIFYFTNSKISMRNKVHTLIVIMIFIISFSIKLLNNLWHITSPIILNYRYSIYLCLFLTTISYASYEGKRRIRKKDFKVLIGVLSILLLLFLVFRKDIYLKETIIFTVLILLFSILTKNKSKNFQILLFIVVISEVIVSGYYSIFTGTNYYLNDRSSYDSMIELGNLNEFPADYRVTYNYSYTNYFNDGFLINKNSSLRYFSSVINDKIINFFIKNNSYYGSNNYILSAYDSPLLLSILGNKYFYLTEELNNGLYKKIKTYELKSYDYDKKKYVYKRVYLYENPYALSIGYVIHKDAKYKEHMSSLDYQNSIIRNFTGIKKDVMLALEWEYEDDSYECPYNGEVFCSIFYITNNKHNNMIYVNSDIEDYAFVKEYTTYLDNSSVLLIDSFDREIDIKILSKYKLDESLLIASTTNNANLIESLTSLQDNMLENVKINKNVLKGQIDSSRDGILFLSIPYDDRFKIYVDGERVNYYPLLDKTFIGLDITSGEHKIVLEFDDSDHYKWYILSSIISLIITVVMKCFLNKKYL